MTGLQYLLLLTTILLNRPSSAETIETLLYSYSKSLNQLHDIGRLSIDSLFSSSGIFKRVCSTCLASHQTIYYVRLTSMTGFSLYSNIIETWSSMNNTLNHDFKLYSTWIDTITDNNAWNYCNYDDVGIGFPRDCGPNGKVGCVGNNCQWNSKSNQYGASEYSYYVVNIPSSTPTAVPTSTPTAVPTNAPTAVPSSAPTAVPTSTPTASPTSTPTVSPTSVPTRVPTVSRTSAPTTVPTSAPSAISGAYMIYVNSSDNEGVRSMILIIIVFMAVVIVLLCCGIGALLHVFHRLLRNFLVERNNDIKVEIGEDR